MSWRFEDYEIETGHTTVGHVPVAGIREFFALSAHGTTHDEAIADLRVKYEERVELMRRDGEALPAPGSGYGRAKFAANDQVEALRPFVDDFWSEVLGTSYDTSYVSNDSTLSTWDYYAGGRTALIAKVKAHYGVEISELYDAPIPDVLAHIRASASPFRLSRREFVTLRAQLLLWILWFWFYLSLRGLAMIGIRTPVFSTAVERVDSIVVRFLFLNVALQIALAVLALALVESPSRQRRKASTRLALLTTSLVIVHIAISIVTAF